jgi:protein-tyrosine phosphatase
MIGLAELGGPCYPPPTRLSRLNSAFFGAFFAMKRWSVWARRFLFVALGLLVCQQAWRHGRDYVFADQFAEVVPGKIYRGAWQQPWPMRRIVREHKIKTILALAHPDNHPLAIREKALAQELGCRWIHIPIVDDRTTTDGQNVSDLLEEAAAVLADPRNQPVYFHCHHGINRASMVQIAYRTLYCGWTLDQATDEISRTFGLVEVSHGPDYRHMKAFYEERVLPTRSAQAAAERQKNLH